MERFSWGKVLDRFTLDFDGDKLEVTKFYGHVFEKGSQKFDSSGRPLYDENCALYHADQLSESAHTVDALVISWIARRRLGYNQHTLVAGIARALSIPYP